VIAVAVIAVAVTVLVTVFVTLVVTLVAVASPPSVPPAPESEVSELAAAWSSRPWVTLPPQAASSIASNADLPTRTSAVAFIAVCVLPFKPVR